MSLCLRNLPNKFTPFVNTRKRVTKIDRHLPKHVKSSQFLEEFLSTPAVTCATTSSGDRSLNSVFHTTSQSSPGSYFDIYAEWSDLFNKKYNWNQQQPVWMQQHKQTDTQILNINNIDIINESVLNNNGQWSEQYADCSWFYAKNQSCLSHRVLLSVDRNLNIISPSADKQGFLYTNISPNVQTVEERQASENRKPSQAQLQYVFDTLSKELPMLFVKALDYKLYTQDILFINNIRGTVTTGILQYVKQIAFLKIISHLRFAYVKLDILKITMHPEDNSIKVRWRIIGMSGTHVFLTFWKLRVWNMKKHLNDTKAWYDGFSTFYVNNDGKIFKHVADKMMPDQDEVPEKVKAPVAALFIPLLGLDY
ncbi:PREDICTED: uncharacterized protein LOC107187874 [Dufourea novaeangliae]|uniref:uncharacterized protein LOC107187874 n=1 Tax=Dufourea novaeangliae TaxID=178035 RepID=UPI0007674A3F|nr:PREDICTED: uncharacterized protein LOC107187874 [Dufourea novaeangliae]